MVWRAFGQPGGRGHAADHAELRHGDVLGAACLDPRDRGRLRSRRNQLVRLFRRFYGRLDRQASLRELAAAMQSLRICVISSIAMLFVALAIVATMTILLSFVFMTELGLRPTYMSILRIALWAMTFHTSSMFCFIFLLYFDLRRPALLIVATYAVLNTVFTIGFPSLGPAFYGYGSMVAAAVTFLLAFTLLLRELPWLHYHAFITNNSSL